MAVSVQYQRGAYGEFRLHDSAARTTTGDNGSLNLTGTEQELRLLLNVTAVSGTSPSLTVTVEDSLDGGTTWTTLVAFAAKTATGTEVVNVTTPFSRTVRVRWAITGTTPSFTFAVSGISQ